MTKIEKARLSRVRLCILYASGLWLGELEDGLHVHTLNSTIDYFERL